MFKLKKIDSFVWPVKLKVPGDGKYDTFEVSFKFKYLTKTEIEAMDDATPMAFCEQLILGWSGVVDENEKPVEFNPENLKKVLAFGGFTAQILKTYNMALAGAAAEKN